MRDGFKLRQFRPVGGRLVDGEKSAGRRIELRLVAMAPYSRFRAHRSLVKNREAGCGSEGRGCIGEQGC